MGERADEAMSEVHADDLRTVIVDGFRQITERLDLINGRTRDLERKTAVLEDRSMRSGLAAAWGGGIGGGIVGLIEVLKWWSHHG